MAQLTLRDLPASVEAHLRQRARIEGRSISKVAADLLSESLGLKEGRRDLGRYSGVWSREETEEFEGFQSQFDEIDSELWR